MYNMFREISDLGHFGGVIFHVSRAIYEYLEEIDFRLLHGTRSGVEVHYRAMHVSRHLGSPMYRASDQPAVYMQSRILVRVCI
jgi:hypothetical protein